MDLVRRARPGRHDRGGLFRYANCEDANVWGGSGRDTNYANLANSVDGGSGNDSISAYFVGIVRGGSGRDYIDANGVGEAFGDSGNDWVYAQYVEIGVNRGSGRDQAFVVNVGSVVGCDVEVAPPGWSAMAESRALARLAPFGGLIWARPRSA